ncbi:unnamed protein product [Rhizophagus irregularis]|nr:unnamed protein product [Rhizophagus irregularis]
MVRKTRSDKKDTICKRCSHECSTSQKLCEHLKRKNPCKLLQKEVASIQTPIQMPIQKAIQASEIKAQVESSSVNISNKEKLHVVKALNSRPSSDCTKSSHISLDSSRRDASNGGKIMSLASIDHTLIHAI